MKTSVILLFTVWIFTAYFYSKENKTSADLREQISLRDSVNLANLKVLDSLKIANHEYSNSFNRLLEAHRKSHVNNK